MAGRYERVAQAGDDDDEHDVAVSRSEPQEPQRQAAGAEVTAGRANSTSSLRVGDATTAAGGTSQAVPPPVSSIGSLFSLQGWRNAFHSAFTAEAPTVTPAVSLQPWHVQHLCPTVETTRYTLAVAYSQHTLLADSTLREPRSCKRDEMTQQQFAMLPRTN